MIKPEFFSSESLSECSFAARLCFIGLWTCADDKGHLKLAPKKLRKDLFGLDDTTMDEFIGFLAELEHVGCIKFYVVGDAAYIDIPNFAVYQTINHPSKTNIPEPNVGYPVSVRERYGSVPPKELIKELIKEARGGDADAPPAPGEDWMAYYKQEVSGE